MLAKYGYDLPYNELRCRVHPTYLGFAVSQRDNNHDEVNQYAEDIHKIWATLVDATPDIPNDFPAAKVDCDLAVRDVPCERIRLSGTHFSNTVKFINRDAFWGGMSGGNDRESLANALKPVSNEQQDALMEILQETIKQQTQAGNNWFSSSFSSQGLALVAQQRPDLVDIWLAGIMDGSPAAKQRLMKGRSFYEALCQVLFSIDPPKGLHLYQHLTEAHAGINFVVKGTGIPVLYYALFDAPDVSAVRNAWDQYLQQCKTDKDLSDLVIVALAGNGINWLESTVEQDLRSKVIFYQARALIIRGLIAAKDSEDWLAAQTKPQAETWFDRVAERAYVYWQTDNWSKHWFERFFNVKNNIHAWAAFRLLLRCVDRRFWTWQDELLNILRRDDSNCRLIFLKNNKDTLNNSIKKNEKAMTENFLATNPTFAL